MFYSKMTIELFFYIGCVFLIGLWASRVTRNMSDFMLGGRSLPGAVAALGAGASDMSGWLLMALPGAVFVHGVSAIWLPIGLASGAYANWYFVAKRLRIFTEHAKDALTIPVYFHHRFQDSKNRLLLLSAVVVVVFFTFYAAAGFVSAAVLLQKSYHISYLHALWLGAFVIVAYTIIGGFLAVSWIDFFQGSLLFVALIVVPVKVFWIQGGWHPVVQAVYQHSHHLLDGFHGVTWVYIFSMLAWGLGYCGQPHILVRFMAMRSAKEVPMARMVCMIWMVVALYGAFFLGLGGLSYYKHLARPSTVFFHFAHDLFNPWVASALLVVFLSAVMSVIAAQLLASASALAEDIYVAVLNNKLSPVGQRMLARLSILTISVVALLIAMKPNSSILKLVSFAWAGLGASFGPVIVLSLYWRRMTCQGATAGMCVGMLVVIIWHYLGHVYGGVFTLYEIIPAFALNLLFCVGVSLYGELPVAQVTKMFDAGLEEQA